MRGSETDWVFWIAGFMIGREPKVQINVTVRDYRDANIYKPSKKQLEHPTQIQVRPDTEIMFQPVATTRPQRYNMNDVLSLTLSS